jgi:sporulation protein YlmC with PRC-barrel domain
MMIEGDDLSVKKLRGSGGHVFAKVTDEEQKKGNLGGPDLFLAGVGRLNEDRFSKYYCNKCEKEFQGSPTINYEKPNEDLGEGVSLLEKGEYRCTGCNNTIAQYRKFNSPEESTDTSASIKQLQAQQPDSGSNNEKKSTATYAQESMSEIDTNSPQAPIATGVGPEAAATTTATTEAAQGGFISIQSLVDMTAYDSEAMLVGRVLEIGLRKSPRGNMDISIKISKQENSYNNSETVVTEEVLWKNISKIGDIVLLGERVRTSAPNSPSQCASCGYQNEEGAVFCEECGKKLG